MRWYVVDRINNTRKMASLVAMAMISARPVQGRSSPRQLSPRQCIHSPSHSDLEPQISRWSSQLAEVMHRIPLIVMEDIVSVDDRTEKINHG